MTINLEPLNVMEGACDNVSTSDFTPRQYGKSSERL
jgi:hypothetical protein